MRHIPPFVYALPFLHECIILFAFWEELRPRDVIQSFRHAFSTPFTVSSVSSALRFGELKLADDPVRHVLDLLSLADLGPSVPGKSLA